MPFFHGYGRVRCVTALVALLGPWQCAFSVATAALSLNHGGGRVLLVLVASDSCTGVERNHEKKQQKCVSLELHWV